MTARAWHRALPVLALACAPALVAMAQGVIEKRAGHGNILSKEPVPSRIITNDAPAPRALPAPMPGTAKEAEPDAAPKAGLPAAPAAPVGPGVSTPAPEAGPSAPHAVDPTPPAAIQAETRTVAPTRPGDRRAARPGMVAPSVSTPPSPPETDPGVRYGSALRALQAAADATDRATFLADLPAVAPDIMARRDTGAALLVAWTLYRQQDHEEARVWFGRARDWDRNAVDATLGLALVAMEKEQFEEARTLATTLPDGHADRARLLGESTLALAQAARARGDEQSAITLYREASGHMPLPRYGRLGWAWADLRTGAPDRAATAFLALYGEAEDSESVEGVLASFAAAGREDELDYRAVTGLLAARLKARAAERDFASKRFLSARALDPDRYGAVGMAGAPRASGFATVRDKSGDSGLSRLDDTVASLEGVLPTHMGAELRLRLDYHVLDSGGLDAASRTTLADALLRGTGQAAPTDPDYQDRLAGAAAALAVDGTHGHVSGVEPLLAWRYEGTLDVEAALGFTLSGGLADPRPFGAVSVARHDEGARQGAGIFVRPIRESILSYTGLRLDAFPGSSDFEGERWGAVRGTGIAGDFYQPLGLGFSASGRLSLENIDGRNTRANDHVAANAGLGFALPLPSMDYAVLGANFAYDHYEHNLSGFTPGNGGYFSPQNFWQAKASLDFQTPENRPALLKGHLDGGRTFKREAAAPYIPLDGFEDFGRRPGSRAWGWAYGIELAGVVQLGDHVQVGGNFSHRSSPQYDETMGLVFLRVSFEPRQSVLSSDLATPVFEGLR